jgi:hypothetical protein
LNTVMTSATGNSTALATSAATPTKNNCMIVTYGGANAGTMTAGSGFTLRTTGADGLGMADLVQTTAASKAGLLTTSSSSQWTIVAIAVEEPGAAYAAVSNSANAAASGSKTVPVPSGAAADDIMVIFMYRESLGAAPTCTGFNKPSNGATGFDELANTSHAFYVGWKRLTGADSGNYTVSFGGGSVATELFCFRVTGCPTTGNPFDVIATGTANSTAAPSVSVTTTVENELLLYGATNFTGGSYTPSGYTERFDGDDCTGGTQPMGSAGSSGSKFATCSTSDRTASWLGALKTLQASAGSFDPKKASEFLMFF